MADEPKPAEVTEEVTPAEPQPATGEPDYDAEFLAAVEAQERAERNRQGYEQRKGKTEEPQLSQEQIDAMVASAVQKALPQMQSALTQDTVESVLNELSEGNEAKKKLIRFHFENSVGQFGTIRERLENAALIADKKKILKTQSELTVALQNRQGLSNSGMGTSTDGPEVQDTFFSKDQIAALKAKGWDDAKIQRLKENMRKK